MAILILLLQRTWRTLKLPLLESPAGRIQGRKGRGQNEAHRGQSLPFQREEGGARSLRALNTGPEVSTRKLRELLSRTEAGASEPSSEV